LLNIIAGVSGLDKVQLLDLLVFFVLLASSKQSPIRVVFYRLGGSEVTVSS